MNYFSLKSMYNKLEDLLLWEEERTEEEMRVFGEIWKSSAPSEVVAFLCKLLLDRTPTRVNLARRNVLPPDNG